MPAATPLTVYAGSAACQECHAAQYAHWSGETKASFVRLRDAPGQPAVDWRKSPVAREDVRLVVGTKRKLAFVLQDWRVLPHEFKIKKRTWNTNSDWQDADYRTHCGPCHLTGVDLATGAFKELNVGCETCHGPARQHCETTAAGDIFVPGKNGAGPAIATCQRCHNGRNKHSSAIRGWQGPYHPR